jgi:hypothetical protein
VRDAVAAGALPQARLDSYAKLLREQARQARQANPAALREQKRAERNLTLASWEHSRGKRRRD